MKQPLDAQLQQQQLEDCAEKATTMTDGNELVVIGSESLQVCFLVSRPQELTESMAFRFPVSQILMRLQSTNIVDYSWSGLDSEICEAGWVFRIKPCFPCKAFQL